MSSSYNFSFQVQNEETINQGKLGLSLYLQYFLAGGGIFLTLLMFFVCILAQVNSYIFLSIYP